jgi:hypothetical protein
MQHPFSAKVLHKAKRGLFPALKGELYQKDVLIGTFKRDATVEGFVPPIQYKFRTEGAQRRFSDFADCLTIEETIEALL